MSESKCSINGCPRRFYGHGFCQLHYLRWWKYGDPLTLRQRTKDAARDFFFANVYRDTDECIVWPFQLSRDGYGRFSLNGRNVSAHELALETRVGPRPDGMEARHGPCHNRACFNVRHLSWGTRAQNMADTIRDETSKRGVRNPSAKLTPDDVRAIRAALAAGETQRPIAARFNVHQVAISHIQRGTTWSHVT